ncbi:MAG: response regulator transcription factor [Roseburia sp.]|jgi:DNA-binding response OmpR family regulator|nr:response regulator transcription factor [Roseburia sp.]
MTEICYVEDDCDIAHAVKEYLTRRGFAVTVCATLAEAKRAIGAHVPALALLDQNMPDGHGDELCRWIRRNYKELPVMILTVRGDAADIVLSFQNGADDYVVKPFELEVLYARILALLRRSGDVSGQYLSCGGITIDQNRRSVSCSGEEIGVSAAEYELLLYLMRNQGKTITRERIVAQVWDANGNFVNDNTLTVTMKRLRDKLHQPSCIRTVRSVGYRMEET